MNSTLKNQPKVSILIPTHNRARYLKQTIESALSQDYSNMEIILVDDGSTDNTREVALSFGDKVKYFYQENRGIPYTRNATVKYATGEYLALLDDDDLWLPGKLTKQIRLLEDNPQAAFICSDAIVINENGEEVKILIKDPSIEPNFYNLLNNNFILNLTAVVRKSIVLEMGGYDENLMSNQDWDLWLRIAKKYPFLYLSERTAQYRSHRHNISSRLEIALNNHILVLHKKAVVGDLGILKRMFFLSKYYFRFGRLYFEQREHERAAECFFNAIFRCPFIGIYHWPKEAGTMRFSIFYRGMYPYAFFFKSLWRSVFLKGESKA